MDNIENYKDALRAVQKKEIEQRKTIKKLLQDREELKKQLALCGIVGQSEQFICRDCEKLSKEYRDQLCEPCHKWHTDS